MSKFTRIPENTFKEIVINAGLLATNFNPKTAEVAESELMGATSGGTSIDSIEAKLSGTFVTLNTALGKKLAAAADETEGKIVPRSALSEEDFADIWLIGDYSGENGNGYIAIRLINALNTGGLQITTQNKAKGQFAFEFTGHYSIKNPEIVPYELYIKQEIGA